MSKNISGAVDRDMLFKKSSDYIKRALESKEADDISMYWLLSSVALELLGKAVLATRDPFDITFPRYYEAILVEARAEARTGVKAIGARIVYEKLEEIVSGFDRENMSFCKDIAVRRNAELHSRESPFESANMEVVSHRVCKFAHATALGAGLHRCHGQTEKHLCRDESFFGH